VHVSDPSTADAGKALLELYDRALPQVYGYLRVRCGSDAVAEDLTAETFLAACAAVNNGQAPVVSSPWLIGVARHKLVDHWRRSGREAAGLTVIAGETGGAEDPWDVHLDVLRARATLNDLAPQHRSALTLRYLDDLPVADVAALLDRTLHATEALLVRARVAFRRAYTGEEGTHA
jgi:RNA polymerase sigma-70 factor (ECF subfamily)